MNEILKTVHCQGSVPSITWIVRTWEAFTPVNHHFSWCPRTVSGFVWLKVGLSWYFKIQTIMQEVQLLLVKVNNPSRTSFPTCLLYHIHKQPFYKTRRRFEFFTKHQEIRQGRSWIRDWKKILGSLGFALYPDRLDYVPSLKWEYLPILLVQKKSQYWQNEKMYRGSINFNAAWLSSPCRFCGLAKAGNAAILC